MQNATHAWRIAIRKFRIAGLLVLAACAAGPPIQEMSDARQAIAAAREAGAAELAPVPLGVAEDQLAAAEAELRKGIYWRAREAADQAKDQAVVALLKSRTLREAGGGGANAGANGPAPR